ncbi:MAG TPA: NAD(P)H-dependent oxidoreductase [Pyrinomonadaceae bacterium]|nr:NAD(P)H-dependent oxidoreductase [Pyrinomonadaceae bacterium]
MNYKPKILAFAGSLRENSYNKRVVKIAAEGARSAGAEVNYIDLRDYPMPIYNADEHAANGFPEAALKFQRLLGAHEGLLISSPEYNASLPGGLKNAIDWASRQSDEFGQIEVFKGKTAAITTASPGSFGGIRCLNHLRSVLTIMQVNVLPTEIAVTFVREKFEGDGEEMTDEKMKGILQNLGASLAESLRKTRGEVKAEKKSADFR